MNCHSRMPSVTIKNCTWNLLSAQVIYSRDFFFKAWDILLIEKHYFKMKRAFLALHTPPPITIVYISTGFPSRDPYLEDKEDIWGLSVYLYPVGKPQNHLIRIDFPSSSSFLFSCFINLLLIRSDVWWMPFFILNKWNHKNNSISAAFNNIHGDHAHLIASLLLFEGY